MAHIHAILDIWFASPHNISRQYVRMWEDFNPSFLPNAEAKSQGIDLSQPWTLDGVQHPALPGMMAGYFSGKPDLGAWVENDLPSNPALGIKQNHFSMASGNEIFPFLNPISPYSKIQYAMNEPAKIRLELCNTLGQVVRILDQGAKQKGVHAVCWNGKNAEGKNLSDGVYYCRLIMDKKSIIKKMLFVR